jgi:hypothetical protein
MYLCLVTKIVTRVIFVQKKGAGSMCPVIRALIVKKDMQVMAHSERLAPKSLREARVKCREPSELCTTLCSIFLDIGTLNIPLALFMYLFICDFKGCGITLEYRPIACNNTE